MLPADADRFQSPGNERRHRGPTGNTLRGKPHLPDFLKHPSEFWPRREAHGSISVQEGSPLSGRRHAADAAFSSLAIASLTPAMISNERSRARCS